jgi:PAS domain S-box-containing protein
MDDGTLQRQWEGLREILDAVPAFIWYKDRENRILRANRPAAESMGLTVAALEGRSTYDLYPDDAAAYHRDDLEVIHSGLPKLQIVEPLLTATGERRWVRTDKVPHFDANGNVIGVVVFAVDITERVRAEDELREARDGLEQRVGERTRELERALESLRAEVAERRRVEARVHEQQAELAHLQRLRTVEGMATQLAHEINQPLAAVVNYASGLARTLRSGLLDVESVREATTEINQQALRAADVVRRLRDFVRKDPAPRQKCQLAAVLREAMQMVEADASRKAVAMRLDVEDGLPQVEIDRIQIEQVIVNLLGNALDAFDAFDDHTPGSLREIVLAARRRTTGLLEVRVTDTGRGLPPGDLRTIFEPFFTTKSNGLGMGLAISESIVVAHGGELAADRSSAGGATLHFTLPCRGS